MKKEDLSPILSQNTDWVKEVLEEESTSIDDHYTIYQMAKEVDFDYTNQQVFVTPMKLKLSIDKLIEE